jgi:catalase
MLMRAINVVLLPVVITFAFSPITPVRAESDVPMEVKLVDAMEHLSSGPYKGFRAVHAKGLVAQAEFIASEEAKSITKASFLQPGIHTPVIVRFSNNSGIPNLSDSDPDSSPRGLAIRFDLGDDGNVDLVMVTAKHFPVATPEEFLQLMNAVVQSKPASSHPSPIEKFLGEHPAAMDFVVNSNANAKSFANLQFNGINSFRMVNSENNSVFIRYKLLPEDGLNNLTDPELAQRTTNYLYDELAKRLESLKIQYNLYAVVAEDTDNVVDSSKAWPSSRKTVLLGRLTVSGLHPNGSTLSSTIMFNPLALTEGIEPSQDPILAIRTRAYAVSFGRRLSK